jgi:hypothetical protein
LAFSKVIDYRNTHRLIPTEYSDEGALEKLALPSGVIADLGELEAVTNERIRAERGQSLTISVGEILQGVPEYRMVNAAFAHAGNGSRFNDNRRGAWYAGVELETSLAEVAFHKRRFLKDSRFTEKATYEYRDFLADFAGEFSHLEEAEKEVCLKPEPVPQCYGPGQGLANMLLYSGSNGIVYPSVRNPRGTCIVCFRPAMVDYPRRDHRYRLTISADADWKTNHAEWVE